MQQMEGVYIENEDGGYNTIEFVTLVNAEILNKLALTS